MNIQQALTLAATKAWSGFSVDNTTFGTADCATMQAEFNSSILYNTNREDFPFQTSSMTFNTVAGQRAYELSVGVVKNVYVQGQTGYLTLIPENPFLDDVQGIPTEFYLKYIGNSLYIYLNVIPDGVYQINVDYNITDFVLDVDTTTKQTFTKATDTLNIPEHLQELFWQCIILRAMQTANKDSTDENYAPIISEYNEFWNTFVRKSKPIKKDGVMTF